MKKILIFGSGGHSRVILSEIIQIKGYKVIGFVDDKIRKGKIIDRYKNKRFKVVSTSEEVKKFLDKKYLWNYWNRI